MKTAVSAALGTALLVGCSLNPARVPEAQPVPLFRKQGETRLAASMQHLKGVNVQAAAAVGEKVSLIAGGAYAQQDNCLSCSKEVARHVELGLGSYQALENGWVRELYAGAGVGRFKVSGNSGKFDPQTEDIVVSGGKYREAFLQANLGRNGSWIDQGVSTRLSGSRFYDFGQWDGEGRARSAPGRHWGVFLEPAYTLRLGYKEIKTETQIGFSLPVYQAQGLDNQMLWITVGLGLNLGRLHAENHEGR